MDVIGHFCDTYLQCIVIRQKRRWRSLRFIQGKEVIVVFEPASHIPTARFAPQQRIRLVPALEIGDLETVQTHINKDFDTICLIFPDFPREAVWDIICQDARLKCPIIETPAPVTGMSGLEGSLVRQYRELQQWPGLLDSIPGPFQAVCSACACVADCWQIRILYPTCRSLSSRLCLRSSLYSRAVLGLLCCGLFAWLWDFRL